MTDYDIPGSSLVLVGCLAKRQHMINQTLQKRSDMEQFHHLRAVFMEDHETGKVVQKPCLFMRQSHSVQLHSRSVCDGRAKKIARVTSVLCLSMVIL